MSVGSLSSIGGGSAAGSPFSAGPSESAGGSQNDVSAFSSMLQNDKPYDVIKIDLPNGMSVGVFHVGGGGFDSQTLKSIEDFVRGLADKETSGQQAPRVDQAGHDGTPAAVGLDKIHVDLPNGISFEILHSPGKTSTDSAAIMKQLTDAAEELAETLGHYSPASSAASAYAAQQAAASGRKGLLDARG
ncbi:hypothetical protein FJN17_21965 [Bradyrhizobium symbiodeficiens]|uniref:Uncharacterized protein n=1 Tax=Bradyrhizobium symbiodeficiens TaxID=1404367 RepID=A0ABX5W9U9_9BRAD|nr:hypothetical protein [Bradyrhizobium symbiodeficiens]QDF40014.1 hypothetical protein FJN17_21965 [Bradyrhizobium symbiodeficiens]